ncbi:hypothetical protein DSM3645_02498 [Blastopirellula marina DSM 3645]|uniref:Uncharacterized protein n=1 Tax=Blastopirellula marina DSM 3645 TaxID=314230 RepID=A3ZVG3_9BACT|nr:hypothetical protein DSM3645_02498 [Blastopirellula marina DSM 3645]
MEKAIRNPTSSIPRCDQTITTETPLMIQIRHSVANFPQPMLRQ